LGELSPKNLEKNLAPLPFRGGAGGEVKFKVKTRQRWQLGLSNILVIGAEIIIKIISAPFSFARHRWK
jgi:hypothetical protein